MLDVATSEQQFCESLVCFNVNWSADRWASHGRWDWRSCHHGSSSGCRRRPRREQRNRSRERYTSRTAKAASWNPKLQDINRTNHTTERRDPEPSNPLWLRLTCKFDTQENTPRCDFWPWAPAVPRSYPGRGRAVVLAGVAVLGAVDA